MPTRRDKANQESRFLYIESLIFGDLDVILQRNFMGKLVLP